MTVRLRPVINCLCCGDTVHLGESGTARLILSTHPDKSWREREVEFSRWLRMKMCLAAVLRGVDWRWRILPEHSAFPWESEAR